MPADLHTLQVCEELGLTPPKWERPHVVQKSRHTVSDEVLSHPVVDNSLLCDKPQLNCDNM